jgi:hypothetical protein
MTTKRGRGRPQKYPLSLRQVRSITNRIVMGQTRAEIAETLGIHPYAVLRVARTMTVGA